MCNLQRVISVELVMKFGMNFECSLFRSSSVNLTDQLTKIKILKFPQFKFLYLKLFILTYNHPNLAHRRNRCLPDDRSDSAVVVDSSTAGRPDCCLPDDRSGLADTANNLHLLQ